MSDQDKDLPAFGQDVESPRLRQKLEAMREAVQKLMGMRGDSDRAAVRWADVKAGRVGGGGNTTTIVQVVTPGGGEGGGGSYTPDLTKPPTPTGLVVTPTPAHIIIEFGAPIYTQGHGHKQTNIYATKQVADDVAELALASAVRVFSAVGPLTIVALPSEPFTKWRVWVRYESNDGVESDPAGGAFGAVSVVPALGESIEDGGIDDIKVARLSAAKLTAGDGTIGGQLKSANYDPILRTGWVVRPDGHVDFRSGYIGGVQIGSDFLRSDTALAGWGWQFKADGTGRVGGLVMEGDALKSSNFEASTSGFRFDADGTFELNGVGGWIRNQMVGDKEISGGKIQDFSVDTLQIAGNAVILPDLSETVAGFNVSPALTKIDGEFTLVWDDNLMPLTATECSHANIQVPHNPFLGSETPFIPVSSPYTYAELQQMSSFFYSYYGFVDLISSSPRDYMGQPVAIFISSLEYEAIVGSDFSPDVRVALLRVPGSGYPGLIGSRVKNTYNQRVNRATSQYSSGAIPVDELLFTDLEPASKLFDVQSVEYVSDTESRYRGSGDSLKMFLDTPPVGVWSYRVAMLVRFTSNPYYLSAGLVESVAVSFLQLKAKMLTMGLKR